MTTIAGHDFVETPDGRRCKNCGTRFVDIAGATVEDVKNKTLGLAHSGVLTDHELSQIRAEVERLWELGRGA
jgi:hypothetical protein